MLVGGRIAGGTELVGGGLQLVGRVQAPKMNRESQGSWPAAHPAITKYLPNPVMRHPGVAVQGAAGGAVYGFCVGYWRAVHGSLQCISRVSSWTAGALFAVGAKGRWYGQGADCMRWPGLGEQLVFEGPAAG